MIRRLLLPHFVLLLLFVSPPHVQAQKNVELVNSGQILSEGNFYIYLEKYSKAENLYLKVGRNDTNYAEVLRDLAYAYRQDKEDSLCAATCRRGLELNSDFDPDFYSLLGISMREMDKHDSSLKTLDRGIALYPYSYILQYQKGMTYVKMKKYPEAQVQFEQAITLNPYSANCHFMLGKTCAEQGRMVPAILAYQYYLLLEPKSERSQKVVSALEDLYSGNYQPDPDLEVEDKSEDKCFADIEELITSQIAASPGYKNKTKINLKLVKQCQAMFEKLHYESGTGNWWMENYVPFFVALEKEEMFVPYINLALYPVAGNNPTVAKSIRKNKKKIAAFAAWAGKYIREHAKHPASSLFPEGEKLSYVYYENNMLAGAGRANEKDVKYGEWYYFFSRSGRRLAHGTLDEKGQRQGVWEWYYEDGTLRERTTYKDDLREGPSEEHYKSGVPGFKCNYVNDKIEGEYEVYGIHGGLTERATMKAGKLEGTATGFYVNGTKRAELHYALDKITGESVFYTIDGKVYSKQTNLNGKKNGPASDYFSSGQLRDEGQYKNDDLFGYWKVYWENGKMKREGLYKDKGLREGVWKEYYHDGTLRAETVYKGGKYSGEMKEYDVDGKLYCVSVFASDKLKKMTYFDKHGKEIASYVIGKSTTVTEYHPNGEKAAQGDYENGERVGDWKVYSSNGGWLTTKEHYNRFGELSGSRTEYYANGKERSELDFSHDMRDGYLKSYYPNGTLESEGWYVEDEMEGDWYFYNERGNVISHHYYIDDEEQGYQEFFDNKGRKSEEFFVRDGLTWSRTRYDSTGAILYKYEPVNGTGKFSYKFPAGNPCVEQTYGNGLLEGVTNRFDYHGTKTVEANFVNGKQHGERKEYYDGSGKPFLDATYAYGEMTGKSTAWWENGNKRWEENYFNGYKDGPQKYYHENGRLQKEGVWDMGDVEGELKYYSEDGMLQVVYHYFDGNLLGYSYLDKDGKQVSMIPLEHASGKVTAYYQNGNKSLEGEFDNGRLTGHVVEYFSDGKIAEDENYDYSDFSGVQKYYYPNGNLRLELNYYADQPDGTWKYYHSNGQLEHTAYYILGDNFGTWKYYDENGQEKKTETWYDDRQLSETLPPPPQPSSSTAPTKPKPKPHR